MCGFIGVIEFDGEISDDHIKSQLSVLNHRGPDSNGFLVNNCEQYSYGLVHNRLSIIDTSDKGHQPVTRSGIDMVYNGEVYNYRELKNDLNQNSFQSDSDTEVVIHNILKKGKDAINDFNGMFAIGYIDKVNHKLQLVRDRLGVKPLYYYKTESSFYFSSEPKGIICQKNFKKSINHSEVHNYFHRGNTSSEDTLFEGMKKLPPGSYLELDLITKKYIITNYWNYNDFINKPNNLSEKPFMRAFEDILDDSIGLRLRSDVPLGVYLSGGYDSSLVAYKSNLLSSKKINSFCIGFEESKFDESIHAKKIANKIGTNHHEFILKKNDIDSSLFKIIDEIIDDPIADPSIIPNLILNKLAKQDITVALSGDGGDELFGGILHIIKV